MHRKSRYILTHRVNSSFYEPMVTEVVQDHLVCRSPTSHNLSLTIRLWDPCSICLSSQFPSADFEYLVSSEGYESRNSLMECSASACRFSGDHCSSRRIACLRKPGFPHITTRSISR